MVDIILPGKDQNKNYQQTKALEKLAEAYDKLMPELKEVRRLGEEAGANGERLKAALMIIAHGFEQAQGVIIGQEINDTEARKHIEEEKVKEEEHGRKS